MEFSDSKQKQNQSLCHFEEVDEDLRRIAERDSSKELCPFGQKCYRKNPKHFQEFKHKTDNETKNTNSGSNKAEEKKAKITDFFNRTPIGLKKLSLEKPKDESDYEIEDDSEEDNVNNVSNNQINTSSTNETPNKRRKFSPSNKDNKKRNSDRKKTNNRSKTKTNTKIEYYESDDDFDNNFKSLLNDDNESLLKPKKLDRSQDLSKNKSQTGSHSVNKLQFKPLEGSSTKTEVNNETPIVTNEVQESSKETETDKTSTSCGLRPKMSPKQLNELIKDIFLFEMPQDFFYLWQFCKNLKPGKPEEALIESLGLRLVGPYDILTGKVKKSLIKDSESILCHWRYFYDLPEFQTIIASEKSGYHLGYFRDTPDEENPVVVSSNGDKSCTIEGVADNIFAAIYSQVQKKKSNEPENKKLTQIELELKKFCERNKIILNANTKLKSRKSKINAPTFHNFGFIVPVSSDEVGYRPLPQTNANLKKLLTRICNIDVEDRDNSSSLGELKEMVQLVNYANDECDFGMGLELGIDLFCFGDTFFHKSILFLLPLAYDLLNRQTFGRIIRAHIQNRRKGFKLDSI